MGAHLTTSSGRLPPPGKSGQRALCRASDWNTLLAIASAVQNVKGQYGIYAHIQNGELIISGRPKRTSISSEAIHDAKVIALHAGAQPYMTCKLVDVEMQVMGDAFNVSCYAWDWKDWDNVDPPLAVSDIIPIARVLPSGNWVLMFRLRGTCPGSAPSLPDALTTQHQSSEIRRSTTNVGQGD